MFEAFCSFVTPPASRFPSCLCSATMGKTGGHRQKRAAVEMLDTSRDGAADMQVAESSESALEKVLLQKWLWGKISGVCLQEIANAACLDGASHSALRALAKLGAYGSHSGNVTKELMTLHGKGGMTPQVETIIAPVVLPREPTKVVQFAVPTIPFHKWVSSLSHHYADDYQRIFGISKRRAFWDSLSESSA